jgi:DNA-binding transcriptional MocR family regulator
MSIEAMQWAFNQDIKPSSMKFVLVALGDNAQHDGMAWPSIAALSEKTGQDRKTVMSALDRLEAAGYLTDTGKRTGSTGQIKVYRFNFAREKDKSPENGTLGKEYRFSHQTVPNFPPKSTVFPHKSTENGTRNPQEPSKEPKGNRHKAQTPEIALPKWVPVDAWNSFVAMRRAIKSPISADGLPLALKKLAELRDAGHDPQAVLEQSVMTNYKGLFAIRGEQQAAGRPSRPNRQEALEQHNREIAKRLAGAQP